MADIEIPSPNPDDYWRRLLQKRGAEKLVSKTEIEQKFEEIEKTVAEQNDSINDLFYLIGKAYTAIGNIGQKPVEFDNDLLNSIKKDVKNVVGNVVGKVEKQFNEFEAWRKEKAKQIGRSLALNAKQQEAMKLYDSAKESFDRVSASISKTINSTTTLVAGVSLMGFGGAKACMSCLSSFVLGVFKVGWKIVDKFISMIGGPIWAAMKTVMGAGVSVAKWVISVGMNALGFIWDGIKTIFSFTLGPVITASKYLVGGVKTFFGWYFKLMINTLFSPSLLNIISFGVITGTILLGLATMLGVGGVLYNSVIKPILSPIFKIVKTVGGWIWSGVQLFWGWLKNQYNNNDMFKKVVDGAWNAITTTFQSAFGGSENLKKVINWISDTYNWIKINGQQTFEKFQQKIDQINDFIKSTPTGTLLSGFIQFLKKYEKIPGVKTAINILQNKFGVSTSGQLNTIRSQIKTQKFNTVKDILEHNILQMKKDNYSESQIENTLKTQIIPKLSNSFDLSSDEAEQAVTEAQNTAQQAYEGKVGLVDAGYIQGNLERIAQLQIKEAAALRGQIDEAGQKELEQYLSLNEKYISSENSRRNLFGVKGGSLSKEEAENLVNYAIRAKEIIDTSRSVPTYDEFAAIRDDNETSVVGSLLYKDYQLIKDSITGSQDYKPENYIYQSPQTQAALNASRISLPKLQPFQGSGGIYPPTVIELMRKHFDGKGFAIQPIEQNRIIQSLIDIVQGPNPKEAYSQLLNLINSRDDIPGFIPEMTAAAREALLIRMPDFKFPGMAKGGIVSSNKILPLDAVGREYIREQVKGINIPEDKKTPPKEEIRNITIIEETVANKESYEIYTMSQLAKGILGV